MPTPAKNIVLFSSLQLSALSGFVVLAAPLSARAADGDVQSVEAAATEAIKAGRLDDAIGKLKSGIARLEEFPRGYYLLGYANRKKEQWLDAAVAYRSYIALRPNEPDAYFGLGKALAGLGDNKPAAAALRKYSSLETRPAAQKFIDEAKADVARLDPPAGGGMNDPASLKATADALKKEGKWPEAVAAYHKAIEADRNNRDLYNDLGLSLFQQQKFDEAAQAFRDATSRDPNFGIGWYNLARALRKADRKADAVDAYKHYMRLEPNDPDPYFGLAQTMRSLGDYSGAAAAFRRYIELEKRPEQAKWVEKAKAELSTLEPSGAMPKSGIDEK